MTNKEFLDIIRTNIDKNGYHITLVNGGHHPDFSYSIGLTEELGFDLIMAGGFISVKENETIFAHVLINCDLGMWLILSFHYLTKVPFT